MPTAVKRLLIVVALGALVAGATGCDVSPPAATVDGVAISQSALNNELSAEIANGGAQCAALMAAGATTSPLGVGTTGDGTTPNAVTPSFADNALETLVLEKLEARTLAHRGVAVTPADVAVASTDYQDQLRSQLEQAQSQSATPAGCTLSAKKSLSSQLPHAFLARQATSLADQEQFEVAVGHVDLSPAAIQAYYVAHKADVTQACVNVIVADSAANAQTVHDAIAAGSTFTTAATSAAADQQSTPPGGTLPCEYPANFSTIFGASLAPTVLALKVGQLAEPLTLATQSSTGAATNIYLVVQMRARVLVPLASLKSSFRQAILSAHISAVQSALQSLVRKSQVTVDPRYGTWSTTRGVTVPVPPAPAFVLNAPANVRATPLLSTGGLTINPASG
jgi:hypothetical protein